MTINVVDSTIGVFEADSTAADSLSNHWPMNEVRGTTGNDVEGSADLSLKSGITVDSGTFDNLPVYGFDGTSNSYASITGKSYSSSGAISSITVAAWVKTTGTTETIISFDDTQYWELVIDSDGKVSWSTADSNSVIDTTVGTTDITDGNWHFVAGTFDSSATPEKRVVVDGTEENTSSPHSGRDLGDGTPRFGFIGVGSDGATSEDGSKNSAFFSGSMALSFVYEGDALTNAELSSIHSSGAVAVPPDFTIPSSDIESLDIAQRIDKRRDAGRIELNNNDGTYDSNANEIDPGDLLRLRTQLEGESSLTHQWTAMADSILYEELDYNRSKLRIEATDFVFGVLSNRITENSYEGIQIASIVNDVLSGESPEIYQDRVQDIDETADAFPRGTNVLDFMNEMAQRANSVISSRDRSLVFEKAQSASLAFPLTDSDRGTSLIRKEGETIVNRARVDGGEHASIDDQQTTQSSTTTVTSSSRITHQLSSRKSQIQKIDLYTSKTGSEESVVVRIQKDDGGSPVAVNDPDSDIVSSEVQASDLTDGGLTTFRMPRDHNLLDPDPWMIIESDGSTGQDIGVDGVGDPRYDAYFRILLSTIAISDDSQDQYRIREHRMFRRNVRTRDSAKELANAKISHGKEPDSFIEFPAESKRAHNAKVGDLVPVNETNLSGDCIISEKTTQYSGLQLQTDLSLQLVSTV